MDALDDELDLKYHRGLKPDCYYKCPTSESLDGALRNELQKNSTSLIPVEIVTEFVFTAGSTITIPVGKQENLNALGILPAEFPQSITVDQALCRDIEGKDRLKTQRAVARSFIDVVQNIDGFKYTERQAFNKEGTDGTRFKYVCMDSLQNRDRKNNMKKDKEGTESAGQVKKTNGKSSAILPTYDCGGAIHIKFSTKRGAVNVIYKHNPIHRDVESRPANGIPPESGSPELQVAENITTVPVEGATQKQKKGRKKKKLAEESAGLDDVDLGMATSPEANRSPPKKRRKKNGAAELPNEQQTSSTKKQKKGKQPESTSTFPNKASVPETMPPPTPSKPVKGPCVRCKEKAIKCNEAKPTCNQCQRGLWVCQYEATGKRKRSKTGCLNCRQRKRKCTEERPSCAYCTKIDDDCAYAEQP